MNHQKSIVILLVGMLFGGSAATKADPKDPPPDPCDNYHCGSWVCTHGTITNSGSLSRTSDTICISNSSSATITAPKWGDGYRQCDCTNDCGGIFSQSRTITYSSVSKWWEDANGQVVEMPILFTNVGTFAFTAKAKAISEDEVCPETSVTTVGTLTVTVVQTGVKSVEFTSDHGVLLTNNVDWTDSGVLYPSPEWVANSTTNSPISHTKNQTMQVSVKVVVKPSGLTFKLKGTGPDAYDSFLSGDNTSTGSEQAVTVSANAPLPNQIAILEGKSIAWTMVVNGTNLSCDSASSGPHKIYVTYGEPTGSPVTEKRLSWVCATCSGKSTLSEIGDKIYDALDGEPPVFKLQSPNIPNPLWLLMSGTNYQGYCEDLAKLMRFQVWLVGGSATIGYVFGSSDTNCFSTNKTTAEFRSCLIHGEEIISVWSAGDWNSYEAVCEVDGMYYAVKLAKGTPVEILRDWLGANQLNGNHQAWLYFNSDTQQFLPCTTLGSNPVPTP